MIFWGFVVWLGIWVILRDFKPVTRAKLMGNPLLMHVIVMGSGMWLHGGSAQGAMAAIFSGVVSAVYVAYQRKMNGYIKGGRWYPGVNNRTDPRKTT